MILSRVRSLNEDDLERDPSIYWLQEHLGFLTDEHLMNVGLTGAQRGRPFTSVSRRFKEL